jgi:hypothetical protein
VVEIGGQLDYRYLYQFLGSLFRIHVIVVRMAHRRPLWMPPVFDNLTQQVRRPHGHSVLPLHGRLGDRVPPPSWSLSTASRVRYVRRQIYSLFFLHIAFFFSFAVKLEAAKNSPASVTFMHASDGTDLCPLPLPSCLSERV